jgi:DNA mismatch repair protein MutS2
LIQSETLDLLEWSRLCEHLATFAATKVGKLAAQRVKLPETQLGSERLLAQTREAYQLEMISPLNFRGIQDIWEALERADRQGILSGEMLLAIATTLAGARQLRRTIDAQDAADFTVLPELVADLRTFPELEQAIHHCIDDRGKVTDRANPRLAGIRQQLKTLQTQIQGKLQRILQRHPGAIQESIITQRGDRYVIPVKAPQKESVTGIVHDVSTSGATLYIEPQSVVELGNQLRQTQRQEEREEESIRQQLTQQVAAAIEGLEQLMLIVTTLDLATARARYSLWLEANPPRFINPDEKTVLRQLRHPLLVWQQRYEDGTAVVPIDVVIQPETRVVAITGPNTGGKTVTLKTLGLVTLMAKIGLFIPAREPVELPWFDQILADIGDEQSLEQSLSTFSGHIKRIGRILASLQIAPDPSILNVVNALVLLDEVGAGTDPSEGSALAIALLKHLANHNRLTIATTHFGELKALKYEDHRFENASVEFDDVSLSPTYRLLWGIPGRSNALTIARRLGLDEEILRQAQALVGVGKQDDVNQVIAGLEAQRRRQETNAEQAAHIVAQAEKLRAEIEQKANQLRDREQNLKHQQEQAIQTAIAEARAEIAQVIRQLQKQPTAQAAQQATEALNQTVTRYLPTGKHPVKDSLRQGYRPKVGERVRLLSLGGQTAEVLTEADEEGRLSVRFGLMKTVIDLGDIESLSGQKTAPIEKPKPLTQMTQPAAPTIRTTSNTLDLRGMRVAEAESALDDFIAKSQGPIWIIHGHGTGKLKRGVHDYLKRHPQVDRLEAADQTDGGTGVTVAYC